MSFAASNNLPAGTLLASRYRIESILGQGGMGAVYLGRVEALNKPVAIKEMKVQDSDPKRQQQAIDQFRQEAQFLANLDHPNLVQVTDYFAEEGRYYLVMAYVQGQNLSQLMQARQENLPLDRVLDWGLQLSSVLSYLHAQNPPVLFRDLKPSNIMLDSAGKIRLIDFGIARSFNPEVATATFLQGVGSAGYAPLEQYQGAGGTDPRSDIYALGATLFHLLTLKVPTSPVELVSRGAAPLSAQKFNPSIPPALDRLLIKMMGLRKDDRYQTMEQVRGLLEQISQSLQQLDDPTEKLGGVLVSAASPPPVPLPQSGGYATTPNQGTDSGSLALWITAGGLCAAALSLFAWMAIQARPTQISTSNSGQKPSPGPVVIARPQPQAEVTPLPSHSPRKSLAGSPPKPVDSPPPRRQPKPVGHNNPIKTDRLAAPSLPEETYPTAIQRPKPSPSPAQPVAPPVAQSPVAQPTVQETPGGAASPSPSPVRGWWGNHPGYPQPLGVGWVQDNKGSWHPPPGAPQPPADIPTSKTGGDRPK